MKKYRITDNFSNWGSETTPETVINEEELKRLSMEWEMDITELMNDLEEIE